MKTMQALPLAKVYQLVEPGPVMLLTTARRGVSNVMTTSWHMMVEFEPPLIACVISENNHSFAPLRQTRQCVLAIPSVKLAKQVVAVGNVHGGPAGIDKFKAFGLTPCPATSVSSPLIDECLANFECRVADTRMVNKYNMFILEVLKAWIDRSQKDRRTIHHCGYGSFVVDGKEIRLPSRMR